jgi:hypothetical protein
MMMGPVSSCAPAGTGAPNRSPDSNAQPTPPYAATSHARETSAGRGVEDEAHGAGYDAGAASSDAFELFKLTRENIALRAQVETLRECLGLFGRRRSEHRGGGGGYGSYGDYGRYERSASRSPRRDRYDDPFASQRMSGGW